MAEVSDASEDAEKERRQLEEIEDCLDTMQQFQGLLGPKRTNDFSIASGRRCILAIEGLKYHKYQKFFEVTAAGVNVVTPYENPNTYVVAPLDSVLRVLKCTVNGDPDAFAAEWARGRAHLTGERRIHDGHVFASVFRDLAELFGRYRRA